MATSLSTIKNWFKTGLKPTQAQFWATWDSFFHKGEKIPVSSIKDLETYLNEKTEREAFNLHLNDEEAHANLFWHYADPVDDLVDLAEIPVADLFNKQRRYVHATANDYFYDAQAAEGNVAPNDQVDGTGFWIKGSLSEIAVKDENGIEKFKFKESVRFKGFNFNASTKTIEVIKKLKEVVVQDKAQLLGDLQSDVLYVIDGYFALGDGETITVPTGGLNIMGYSFDASNISSYGIANHTIFDSPAEGSGNLIIHNIAFTTTGAGSKVFDIVDSDGSHAVEMVTVNFEGCQAIGKMRNYRQGTGITIGFYGCKDGLILSGAWNGFKLTNTNCFGFDAAGTLFKKDVDTVFSNRLFLELNMDLPAGAKLIDFDQSNFAVNDLLQFNSTILKYDGLIDDANAELAIPNIRANNPKCLWRSNVGIPDTAIEKFVDAEVDGAFAIDWLNDTFNIVMTGDTTFTDKNLPASGKSTKEIQVYLTGEFTPTFPPGWKANQVGTYKGSEVNKITLKFIKAGLYFMKIDNSLTVYPAPAISSIEPNSMLPEETKVISIYGSFFTPEAIVRIGDLSINETLFVSSGEIQVNVTSKATEQDYDITVSNGTETIKQSLLTVNIGTVTTLNSQNAIAQTGQNYEITDSSEIKCTQASNVSGAVDFMTFDTNKDFQVRVQVKASPFITTDVFSAGINIFELVDTSDNSVWADFRMNSAGWRTKEMRLLGTKFSNSTAWAGIEGGATNFDGVHQIRPNPSQIFTMEYKAGVLYEKNTSGTIIGQVTPASIPANLLFRLRIESVGDIVGIKYIELPQEV